jgi:hypothetical protein
MRDLLIRIAIAILSAVAWTATTVAGGPGHGGSHGAHGHGTLEGQMRHGGGHAEHAGMIFPSQLYPGVAEPGPDPAELVMSSLVVGAPQHLVAGHLASPALHPFAHIPLRSEQGEALTTQPTAPSPADSDQSGAATSPANPAANPSSPRPPGAAGPGRPVSGRSGPGQPGPGRPASPRW